MAGLDEEKQKQKTTTTTTTTTPLLLLPRVRILYCEQCKWMLRAAYFAQELLSTFSNSIGEVALVPSTGGVFVIDITHVAVVVVVGPTDTDADTDTDTTSTQSGGGSNIPSTKQITTRLWDRKVDGGFPETKTLKKLVRDIIDPSRDLGHVDGHKKTAVTNPTPTPGNNNNNNNNNNDSNDKINTDDIGKKESSRRGAHDIVLVADQDPILSWTGQEAEAEAGGGGGEGGEGGEGGDEGDSSKQEILGREEDDVAKNKSGEKGVATKESDQKKKKKKKEKVCDDCA